MSRSFQRGSAEAGYLLLNMARPVNLASVFTACVQASYATMELGDDKLPRNAWIFPEQGS